MPSTKHCPIKRLYFDIETAPNVVYCWETGYKIDVNYHNIIKERAVICIAYKWEGEKTVRALQWSNGDDRAMLEAFSAIVDEAHEVVTQNGDRFDIPWLRTRCAFHDIPFNPLLTSVDTFQMMKSRFKFNSNALNYVGKYLGLGEKEKHDGFDLWKRVIAGDEQALAHMIRYCKRDVVLLEGVYKRLQSYTPYKTHVGVLLGGEKVDCPRCGSERTHRRGVHITAMGYKQQDRACYDCKRRFRVPLSAKERGVME